MLLSCRMDHFGNYVLGDQTKESHNLRVAIHESRYFKKSRPLAVVSGAGIAGLAASFELRIKGFEVAVVEKRRSFSRFNIINLSVETKSFHAKIPFA